jgi:hypothetical protein
MALASLVQFGKNIHMLHLLHSLRFFLHFGYIFFFFEGSYIFFLVSVFSAFCSIYMKWVLILILLSIIFFVWLKIVIDFTLFFPIFEILYFFFLSLAFNFNMYFEVSISMRMVYLLNTSSVVDYYSLSKFIYT